MGRYCGNRKKRGRGQILAKPLFSSAIADCLNECIGNSPTAQQAFTDNADDFSGHNILLAEDVDINREIVQTLLQPTMLSIDCAVNGAEAVKVFSENAAKYDVIFMDIQMPEMDGFEATRRIRALDLTCAKTVPIIAMTANVFREDVEKCLAVGMNDHVGKPLDFDEVLQKLHKYLRA